MIGSLNGTLIQLDDSHALLEVQGVGYEVFVGKGPRFPLPPVGERLKLWIHTYVREDQLALFGFPSAAHKAMFRKLNTVSGVGPKLAFALVASLPPRSIVDALITNDIRTLSSVSGVGKKMAERMVLELKSNLDELALLVGTLSEGPGSLKPVWLELTQALAGLGFPDSQVRNVIRLLQKEGDPDQADLNLLLKLALQKIHQC